MTVATHNSGTRVLPLRRWWDPETVFTALFADREFAVWLDTGNDGAGTTYLAAPSQQSRYVTASVLDGTVTVRSPDGDSHTEPGTIFDYLDAALGSAPYQGSGFPPGWVGWFGYELAAQTMAAPHYSARTPDAAFVYLDRGIVFDHTTRTVTLVQQIDEGATTAAELEDWFVQTTAALHALPASRAADRPLGNVELRPTASHTPTMRWRHSAEEYRELIRRCQQAIHRGDAYQLCLTNEIRCDQRPDPATTYLALRAVSPSHHGGYLRFGDIALLSASPEQFLRIDADGIITVNPMKGTRPRSADPARDAQLAAALLVSDKERAENLMIVDLMRNDVGRVARLGSVTVPALHVVESYPQVHQLVSTVTAERAPGVGTLDVIRSCFPAGSMTGAPKLAAVSALRDLEAGPRGIYSGAFGYLALDGSTDLAMTIRSIVIDADGASIGTGGGITALSIPDEEIEEIRIKARALLRVLGVPEAELDVL